jgi:hypothetical protein
LGGGFSASYDICARMRLRSPMRLRGRMRASDRGRAYLTYPPLTLHNYTAAYCPGEVCSSGGGAFCMPDWLHAGVEFYMRFVVHGRLRSWKWMSRCVVHSQGT